MNKKLSTFQLVLLSTGGMIGCGWLFSPFYGYQTAGVGVILSWIITAIITFTISLSFAESCANLPILGGISRFMSITHKPTVGIIFLIVSWLSYVVYLPLEAQSVMQYLSFWFPKLVVHINNEVELSYLGIATATGIIIAITWFNTLAITKVGSANVLVSIWKIIIPIMVALIVIIGFGSWHNLSLPYNLVKATPENIFLAITSSGLAFAFSGFQNGLILANQVKNPAKALPYSLYWPVIIGLILYLSLSLSYLLCLNQQQPALVSAAAPLLGLLALFGLNAIFVILFMDAVIAPLGTTNVYIAVTGRVLCSLMIYLAPNSRFTQLNKNLAPTWCLWFNALIGCIFLFPFPTWKDLVGFLSSLVIFAYLAGPISLLVLRGKLPDIERKFKLPCYKLIGYIGFILCSSLIYWSGYTTLKFLTETIVIVLLGYSLIKKHSLAEFIANWYLVLYPLGLTIISFLHKLHIVAFPYDNYLVVLMGIFFCWVFSVSSLPVDAIKDNLAKMEYIEPKPEC
jgi:amino acid transporter